MSLKLRFVLVVGVMLAVFGATLLVMRNIERRQLAAALREAQADARRQIERLLELDEVGLRQLVRDWSGGEAGPPAGGEGAAGPRSQWAALARGYGADALWMVAADGAVEPLHGVAARLGPARLGHAGAARHFFMEADGLWEIARAPRAGAAGGWHVAGRRWTPERIEELARTIGGSVRLIAPDEPLAPVDAGALVVDRVWRDAEGRVLRTLRASRPVGPAVHTDAMMIRLLVGFGVLLLAALALAVQRWILRPLDRIGESLARESLAPLRGLDGGSEFARLARLAEESFVQKAELRREIDERRRAEARLQAAQEDLRQSIEVRSRLARNLHDTVIQSIYATGLGLERARMELAADPVAAAERLAHCRTNLNETIRDVRGFISDLEPESLRRQPFAQALRSLAYTMQSLWVAAINVELDEAVAARFSAIQETHLLQIVREAISNALRHGEASRIRVLLQPDAGGHNALLKVQDNGRGFEPAHRTGEGRGLANMANRVRELGGSLRLQTEPGAGTTLVLRIPLSAAA